MTWGAIGAAAIGTVGGAMMSKDGGGGGATQTVSKDPWAPAQPWLTSLLSQGQNLQGYYEQNPFNALQQSGYANVLAGNDYINQMVPGLLAQMNQTTGFDRNNPRAKPQMLQMPAMTGNVHPMLGLLTADPGSGNATGINAAQSPYRNGGMPASTFSAAPAGPAPLSAIDWARSLGASNQGNQV